MSAKNIIRQLIREELTKALKEAILVENAERLDEARKRLKRTQIWSKKKERGVYTSAGTLPSSSKTPRSKVDPAKRDAEGKKLINLYARGDVRGGTKKKDSKAQEFRKKVDDIARDQYGGTPTAKEKNSVIWAQASMRSKVASNLQKEKGTDGKEKLVRVPKADSAAGKARAQAAKAQRLANKKPSKKSK